MGTGGGLRRIEPCEDGWRETLHHAYGDHHPPLRGDPSPANKGDKQIANYFLRLPQDEISGPALEGASRIRARDGEVAIANFSALDGLSAPVRDVAVDDAGIAWLATDQGAFRIMPNGVTIEGTVVESRVNEAGRPGVMEADVRMRGTPFHTVTDHMGGFTLASLPPDQHVLQVDGNLAPNGPYTAAFREVDLTDDAVEPMAGLVDLPPVELTPLGPRFTIDPAAENIIVASLMREVRLEIPPGAITFPEGKLPSIQLTALPCDALPFPLPPRDCAVAAVELRPVDAVLNSPITLTLPALGLEGEACQDVFRFDETRLDVETRPYVRAAETVSRNTWRWISGYDRGLAITVHGVYQKCHVSPVIVERTDTERMIADASYLEQQWRAGHDLFFKCRRDASWLRAEAQPTLERADWSSRSLGANRRGRSGGD